MKKLITLFLLCVAVSTYSYAQDFAFMCGDKVLENNAEVTINAIVQDLGDGSYQVEAGTNPHEEGTTQYYIKAIDAESVNVAVNSTIVSASPASLTASICCGGQCDPMPCVKNITVTKEATVLQSDVLFTKPDYFGGIDGTVKVKLEATGGTETRVLYITFTYNSSSVESVLSNSDVTVAGNVLTTHFDSQDNTSVTIYSVNGQQVADYSVSGNATIDLSTMPKGFYVYTVKCANSQVLTNKFVVK